MIRITCVESPDKFYETYSVTAARNFIISLKEMGLHPQWTCADPEDNQYLWESSL